MRVGKRDVLIVEFAPASDSEKSLSGNLRHREKLASVFLEYEGGHFVG